MTRNRSTILTIACAVALALATSRVQSASISISTATTNNSSVTATAITVTQSNGNSSGGAGIQSLNVINPGTSAILAPGATVSASTQYIANIAADRDQIGNQTATGQVSVNYTDSFTITPDIATATYNVIITSSLLGALTGNNDSAGNSSTGAVSITNVAGSLGGTPNPNLALAVAGSGAKPASGTSSATISGSNLLSLGPFTGTQTLQLTFTWTMSATSNGGAALQTGPEEAVRLGAAGQLAFATADDYPGVGSRTQALDGHFVSIVATVVSVPEPSTIGLAAIAGLALIGFRRRMS
jgi:hypothetical protein